MPAKKLSGHNFFLPIACICAFLFSCADTVSTRELLDLNFGFNQPFTVTPTTLDLLAGESRSITASGGKKPYKYKIFTGIGSVSTSGIFTSSLPGVATIQIDDSSGLSAIVTATIRSVAKDPATLTTYAGNMRLWLKVDSLALTDGAAVATWPDSSGNGVVVSQGTALNQPIFKASIFNGWPAVRFNGLASANYSNFGLTLPVSNDITLFVAATPSASAYAFMIYASGSGIVGPAIISNHGTRAYEYFMNNVSIDRFLFQSAASGLNVLTFRQSAMTDLQLVYNGTPQVQSTPAAVITGASITTIGGNNGSTSYGGDIAEIIVYNTPLPSADRAAIECYLIKKYNIAGVNVCQ